MSDQGLGRSVNLDGFKTDLDGMVSVGFGGFDLQDGTGTGLDDRYGSEVPGVVIHLGHSNFFT